jgi:hypothetical protein
MMRPKPMPIWLRNRVAYFFLGCAALMIALNTVVIGLHVPVFPYIIAGIAILGIVLALWMTLAPIISDEEFQRQVRERR